MLHKVTLLKQQFCSQMLGYFCDEKSGNPVSGKFIMLLPTKLRNCFF
jgi:hypothetical protein